MKAMIEIIFDGPANHLFKKIKRKIKQYSVWEFFKLIEGFYPSILSLFIGMIETPKNIFAKRKE